MVLYRFRTKVSYHWACRCPKTWWYQANTKQYVDYLHKVRHYGCNYLSVLGKRAPYGIIPTDISWNHTMINTLRPRQYGRHFADDTFKCIFMNENVGISIEISLEFVPKGPINNIPALVQVMAWRRPGDKPLIEPMVVRLLMHICVTRLQWVKRLIMKHTSTIHT